MRSNVNLSFVSNEISNNIPPVLLITWKRPLLTKRIIAALRKVKPAKVYLASDGPRENVKGEDSLVLETRSILRNCIDWNCEIHEYFSYVNQGCALGVSNAITWFFQFEEEGIILEDDCLPDQNFFRFCAEMLDRYRVNPDIMHISGVNFALMSKIIGRDYRFSLYSHIWGWATWRDRWNKFKLEITDNDIELESVLSILKTNVEKQFWKHIFSTQRDFPLDTWDYSWQYSIWKNRGISILPNINLVTNIGFGIEATHTIAQQKNSLVYRDNICDDNIYFLTLLNIKKIQLFLDYLNFLNAFKSKNISVRNIKYLLKYILKKY